MARIGRTTPRGAVRAAVTVLVLLVPTTLAACSSTADPVSRDTAATITTDPAAPAKNGTGETRTDLEPLTSRFSALGDPVGATWFSGTVGDADVPGPTTYWIDAVVELDPALAQELVAQTSPQETAEVPDVVADLGPSLPDGPLLTGPDLDAAFAESGFTATAYLDPDDATLVLVTVGE